MGWSLFSFWSKKIKIKIKNIKNIYIPGPLEVGKMFCAYWWMVCFHHKNGRRKHRLQVNLTDVWIVVVASRESDFQVCESPQHSVA